MNDNISSNTYNSRAMNIILTNKVFNILITSEAQEDQFYSILIEENSNKNKKCNKKT